MTTTDLSPREKIFGSSPVSDLDYLTQDEVLEAFSIKGRTLRDWRAKRGFPDPSDRRYNLGAVRAYVKMRAEMDRKRARDKMKRFMSLCGQNCGQN